MLKCTLKQSSLTNVACFLSLVSLSGAVGLMCALPETVTPRFPLDLPLIPLQIAYRQYSYSGTLDVWASLTRKTTASVV